MRAAAKVDHSLYESSPIRGGVGQDLELIWRHVRCVRRKDNAVHAPAGGGPRRKWAVRQSWWPITRTASCRAAATKLPRGQAASLSLSAAISSFRSRHGDRPPSPRVGRSKADRRLRHQAAAGGHRADFWVFLDVRRHKGVTLRIESLLPAGSRALDAVEQSDDLPNAENLYREKHRPQFHFTARRGWLNDPNGLVWANGKYHLCFQHNPFGWEWGNMHWGHATSPDLFHWTELPTALTPREHGDGVFSGSAVVDTHNTSGWGSLAHLALVAAFTSVKRGECLVYSTDGGQTFTEFEKNPILVHTGRDPRLLWYAPTKRWILAVYDSKAGKDGIAFLSSPDFKTWTAEGRIDGFFECPDLFELPVIGRSGESRWVIYSGDGEYRIGQFDGHAFQPETTRKERVWYGDFYAAQTFSQVPDNRRIQIGWGRNVAFPDMPFNQQMTVPVELTLRPTSDGLRLFASPVRELAGLRKQSLPTLERTVDPKHPFHQDLRFGPARNRARGPRREGRRFDAHGSRRANHFRRSQATTDLPRRDGSTRPLPGRSHFTF